MQHNVTELTHRLLAALDSTYNVIDMPAVVEIVSLLEKVKITKELLETTRLGKHVNELRRRTDNESLSRRAKELVRKWRSLVLPSSTASQDSNGQLKTAEKRRLDDVSSAVSSTQPVELKRVRPNGQTNAEMEFSDNSNSSMKDVRKEQVILINSDSNSSLPEMKEPLLELQQPKKRGRKKGSKNHKNLIDEAETSFTNKLAVSRGNSKVKTTQELIAGLQNKTIGCSPVKQKEDLNLRAAKLTERVSIIDQKLNTNANRYRNKYHTKITLFDHKNDKIIESGSVINDKSLLQSMQDDVIVVDDADEDNLDESSSLSEHPIPVKTEEVEEQKPQENARITAKSVEECLALLPPIDSTVLYEQEACAWRCSCLLKQVQNEEEDEEERPVYEFVEDAECAARLKYEADRQSSAITPEELHAKFIESVNGNWGVGKAKPDPSKTEDNLYVNVVPNVNTESIAKDVCNENYNKYSISECAPQQQEEEQSESSSELNNRVFREWHEVLEVPSYNGEICKILPYVIID